VASHRIAEINSASDCHTGAAVDLLVRFFAEEGFTTPRDRIARNLETMLGDGTCWTAVLIERDNVVGVITVSTMLYVEHGRLAEIGDLYVAPACRGRGLARALIDAAIDWSRRRGCSGVFVTVTPEGEASHRLSDFYKRLDFEPTGRTTMIFAGPHLGHRHA
jgi:aminoglycoside 6'-N-acetyltransferase I